MNTCMCCCAFFVLFLYCRSSRHRQETLVREQRTFAQKTSLIVLFPGSFSAPFFLRLCSAGCIAVSGRVKKINVFRVCAFFPCVCALCVCRFLSRVSACINFVCPSPFLCHFLVPFCYVCECDLFCLRVVYTVFAVAACLRPCPEDFGCDCAHLTSLCHSIVLGWPVHRAHIQKTVDVRKRCGEKIPTEPTLDTYDVQGKFWRDITGTVQVAKFSMFLLFFCCA